MFFFWKTNLFPESYLHWTNSNDRFPKGTYSQFCVEISFNYRKILNCWQILLGIVLVMPNFLSAVSHAYPAIAVPRMNLDISAVSWFSMYNRISLNIKSIIVLHTSSPANLKYHFKNRKKKVWVQNYLNLKNLTWFSRSVRLVSAFGEQHLIRISISNWWGQMTSGNYRNSYFWKSFHCFETKHIRKLHHRIWDF